MITQANIVTYCINDSNFDTTLITDEMINISLERHIKPLLGERLFNQVILDTSTYDGLLTGETYTYGGYPYKWLGLKPMASWFALYDALPFIHEQIRGLGVRVNNDETSQEGNLSEARKNAFQMAQSYMTGLSNYITRKQTTTSIYNEYLPKKRKITGGLFL